VLSELAMATVCPSGANGAADTAPMLSVSATSRATSRVGRAGGR
jgi:hypothetical protein